MSFSELGLAAPLLRTLSASGYSVPTPIQAQAIPPAIEGRDVLGCAQTGTGKTAAFALPLIQRLMEEGVVETPAAPPAEAARGPGPGRRGGPRGRNNGRGGPRRFERPMEPFRPLRALVLAPTRELAVQIAESIHVYAEGSGLRLAAIYGGVGYQHQIRAFKQGVDILVATPGRLVDLLEQGYGDFSTMKIFVLDEADRMLDMGFMPDLRKIIGRIPEQRQTLFFSATMPREIAQLANELLRDPVRINIAPAQPAAERIEQSVCFVPRGLKSTLLVRLLAQNNIQRAIVFTRTKHGADRVAEQLDEAGIRADAIHGNKSQNARQRALNAFRDSQLHVLVATDLAARGIDVDGITHVFNYDLPNEPETYVHRIGRTARAGASGKAISFCDREERGMLRGIERLLKKPLKVETDLPVEIPAEERSEGRDSRRGGSRPYGSRAGAGSGRGPRGNGPGGYGQGGHSQGGYNQGQSGSSYGGGGQGGPRSGNGTGGPRQGGGNPGGYGPRQDRPDFERREPFPREQFPREQFSREQRPGGPAPRSRHGQAGGHAGGQLSEGGGRPPKFGPRPGGKRPRRPAGSVR